MWLAMCYLGCLFIFLSTTLRTSSSSNIFLDQRRAELSFSLEISRNTCDSPPLATHGALSVKGHAIFVHRRHALSKALLRSLSKAAILLATCPIVISANPRNFFVLEMIHDDRIGLILVHIVPLGHNKVIHEIFQCGFGCYQRPTLRLLPRYGIALFSAGASSDFKARLRHGLVIDFSRNEEVLCVHLQSYLVEVWNLNVHEAFESF